MENKTVDLTSLTDDEIYGILFSINDVIKDRLIDLIVSHGVASVEFGTDSELEIRVFDAYGMKSFADGEFERWITVRKIGFENGSFVNGEMCQGKYLYFVSTDDVVYEGDEIDDSLMWDIYKYTKDEFEKPAKQDEDL